MATKKKSASGKGRPIIIVDLDGTVADVKHRLHHIEGPGKKNWKRFFQAMDRDPVIESVADFVRKAAESNDIVILSGRPDHYRDVSEHWLKKHKIPYTTILLRRAGDRRPDYVAKEDLLRTLDLKRVVMALDDRPPVCEMYQRNGIKCVEIRSDVENQLVNEAYREAE